jgi:hypothetical protein
MTSQGFSHFQEGLMTSQGQATFEDDSNASQGQAASKAFWLVFQQFQSECPLESIEFESYDCSY